MCMKAAVPRSSAKSQGSLARIVGNSLRITFFGLAKKLAMIESYSSSGSGWEYGATVTLVCKETGAEATVTSW